jgi:hypothetical protein
MCSRGRDGCGGGGGCGNALSRPRIQDRTALRLAVLPSPVPCLAHIIRKLRRRRGPPPTSASAWGTTRACVPEVARAGTRMGWAAMRAPAAGVSSRRRRGNICMYERAPRALSPARGPHTPRPASHERAPHPTHATPPRRKQATGPPAHGSHSFPPASRILHPAPHHSHTLHHTHIPRRRSTLTR